MSDRGSFVIRRMEANDAPAVKSLEIGTGLSPWPLDDYVSETERDESVALVAARETTIVGFVIARLITISNHPGYSPDSITNLEIYNLAVAHFARRQGIGEALFRAAVDAAKIAGTLDFVELEVRSANLDARRFYEQLGFRQTGLRRAFYSNPPDDAVQMALGLMNA